ncbi:La domain containing protein [Trichomonas vaginalis G3]|uniref:La domain containing protein n=1 Tax=Trichomonas vaginalis (strain ATCC PRA-98 / G3) TaxID=412133 RepID=A2EPC2_TRIV3|nr:RNA binding [Trichomonas vaginalis G3]EAY05507.1 La domain containing protein [Trichomonas vaginalis G3]KAI5507819.1 RNA binding [Trichomonas vaginalis G3]|eukprot:XP_001317730.1 La domain containing protein [Trichomonas vaginalis G3]
MEETSSYLPRLGSMIALEKQSHPKDPADELSPVMQRAKDQMEYYFNNFNLERDKFMLRKYQETSNKIPVDVFMTFNQMKKLEISADNVLYVCSKSKHLKVDFGAKTISRIEEFKKDYFRNERSLRITGFPLDYTSNDLDAVLSKYDPVWIVPQSKFTENGEKLFNGNVIVEFKSEEDLQEAIKGIKDLNGVELQSEILSDFEQKIKNMKKSKD